MPGRHERHLRRCLDPLFPRPVVPPFDEALLEAQRLDHDELIAFVQDLREAVAGAVRLQGNEGSEVVLDLKERLEQLYERAAGLAEDQASNQAALRKLIDVIMRSVRHAAGNDPLAQAELDQEEAARALHFAQLAHPLVADLLDPDSLIAPDELAPALLCEPETGYAAALVLFDAGQLAQLCADARGLLEARDPDRGRPDAWDRLVEMDRQLTVLLAGTPRN